MSLKSTLKQKRKTEVDDSDVDSAASNKSKKGKTDIITLYKIGNKNRNPKKTKMYYAKRRNGNRIFYAATLFRIVDVDFNEIHSVVNDNFDKFLIMRRRYMPLLCYWFCHGSVIATVDLLAMAVILFILFTNVFYKNNVQTISDEIRNQKSK